MSKPINTAEKKRVICDVCKELYRIAQANPEWGAGLRFAAYYLATDYRIPKSKRLWENHRIPKRRKKNAKNVEVPS